MKGMTRLLFLLACVFLYSISTAFASRVLFDAKFFEDISKIKLHITVTNTPDNSALWYNFDQQKISSPLSSIEIQQAIVDVFEDRFANSGIEMWRGENKEKDDLPSLGKNNEQADPFAVEGQSNNDRLDIYIFVVMDRTEYKDTKNITYGAIGTKLLRPQGRHGVATNMITEGFPVPFILGENKEQAINVIKESLEKAFNAQMRWLLCQKNKNIKCYKDLWDAVKEKRQSEKNDKQ